MVASFLPVKGGQSRVEESVADLRMHPYDCIVLTRKRRREQNGGSVADLKMVASDSPQKGGHSRVEESVADLRTHPCSCIGLTSERRTEWRKARRI